MFKDDFIIKIPVKDSYFSLTQFDFIEGNTARGREKDKDFLIKWGESIAILHNNVMLLILLIILIIVL